ncbi:hypothetical protein AB0C34_26820, partial [Nocardia sp. NPDC049220]
MDLIDSVQAGMKSIENMQRQSVLLTSTGLAANERVMSINAEGAVIETRFTDPPERLAAESEAMVFADTEQPDRDVSQSGVTDS